MVGREKIESYTGGAINAMTTAGLEVQPEEFSEDECVCRNYSHIEQNQRMALDVKDKNNNGTVVIMNFTGAYEAQDFYREQEAQWVDLRNIQGTNCYCGPEGEEAIKSALGALKPEGLHFLDSGNYHYVSKIWLDKIEEEFQLLVFDHHTDMQVPAFGDILSCGGWIKQALDTNPLLHKVYLAGPPDSEELRSELEQYGPRLVWIGEEKLEVRSRGAKLGPGGQTALEPGSGIISCLDNSGLPIYISFDKDILSPSEAVTNWDQGQAKLKDVLNCIREAASRRSIIGADICGEDPEGSEQGADWAADVNNRVNREIVCEFQYKL